MMQKKKFNQKTSRLTIIILAGLVLLISALQAHTKVMQPWEISIFRSIYDWPLRLRPLILIITQAGSSWMVAIVVCILYFYKKVKPALQVLFVGLMAFGLTEFAKWLIGRPRPYVLLANVQARERFVSGMGFPSGHAAVTTAVVLVLARYVPAKYRWLLAVWLIAVLISRIYLGMHAPLDIVGGVALGTIVTESLWLAWPKIGKPLRLGK